MNCKGCKREAKMFWKDKAKTTGHSETFYRDLCYECYVAKYGTKPKSLHDLNEERKKQTP